MKIKQGSDEVAYESASIREGIDLFTSEISFVSMQGLSAEAVTIEGKSFTIYRCELLGEGRFEYKLYPTKYADLLNTTLPMYKGTETTENMLKAMGINLKTMTPTQVVPWDIPALKVTNLLSVIKDNILVSNGGGTCLTFDLDGDLKLIDFKSLYSLKSAVEITGTIAKSASALEWCKKTPGEVDIVLYNSEGIQSETKTFQSGAGKGTYRYSATDSITLEDVARRLANQFYRNWYRSMFVEVSDVIADGLTPGMLLNMNGSKFILTHVSSTLQSGVSTINVTLAKCLD